MSAPSADAILLAPYDPVWPRLFEEERDRLEAAIGQWTVAIEHVGSTAVPGLAAKPVIDIGVALGRFEDALLCITPVVQMGYVCKGEFGIPGRIFFHKETDNPIPGQTLNGVSRTHQIHMYERGHWEDVAHILFRDALRADPALARDYADLKAELAARHGGDVDAYADAKSAFVRAVVTRARRAARPPIAVVDYDPDWPAQFEAEKERLLTEIGEWVLAVEHIGSTAVPGLAAKPIIDIMPGVRSLDDADRCVEGMRRLGYEYVPEFEDALSDRRYFRKGHPQQRWHAHIVETGGEFWRRHLFFRDYLRSHPDAVAQYAALKRRLAAQFPRDSLAYTDAKSEFILAIEEKAAAAPGRSLPSAERGIQDQQ
jgi:GrpB-like predicted nucleotidyltransferase (UPF0157 family)